MRCTRKCLDCIVDDGTARRQGHASPHMSLRRTFGRPGPLHFLVAAGVGVGTGYYTFEPAVRKHFEKQGQHGLTAEPKSDTGFWYLLQA
ncbi:hypothetical protein ABBQ38_010912 [Trebouxia sp. C0009 RCD-2024]